MPYKDNIQWLFALLNYKELFIFLFSFYFKWLADGWRVVLFIGCRRWLRGLTTGRFFTRPTCREWFAWLGFHQRTPSRLRIGNLSNICFLFIFYICLVRYWSLICWAAIAFKRILKPTACLLHFILWGRVSIKVIVSLFPLIDLSIIEILEFI